MTVTPAMTKKAPNPLQSALPMSPAIRGKKPDEEPLNNPQTQQKQKQTSQSPSPSSSYPKAKLRQECRDLYHEGSTTFFSNANPATLFPSAVSIVLSILYGPRQTTDHIPPTRSVTLILRSMPGVAYTIGLDLDDDHKEIHFSLDYIAGISSRTPGREAAEIQGVIVHEMVHAWQWNALGTAPSGLIEGIADFVRLKAGLSPPHWKREVGGQWDAGYQHTAYFLDWVEDRYGKGSVRKINAALQYTVYKDTLWMKLFGHSVNTLWQRYQTALARHGKGDDKGDGDDDDNNDHDGDAGKDDNDPASDETPALTAI